MSEGNLTNKLVAPGFWPACSNCVHNEECARKPKHDAYPHSWHWGREAVTFPEGDLVLVSWVGTLEIGAAHTGCTSYEVSADQVVAPGDKHREYLQLEGERREIDARLRRFEHRADELATLSDEPAELALPTADYERLEQIEARQQQLLAT